MTDFKLLVKTLDKLCISYRIFKDPLYLYNYNKIRQSFCLSLGDIDFNFNKKEKFLGTNNCYVNSFKKPKRKK